MCWSHRSNDLTHRLAPVLIVAVVFLILSGTTAMSTEAPLGGRTDDDRSLVRGGPMQRGEGVAPAHDPAEKLEIAEDVSARYPAGEPPRPRAEASFPERAPSLPELRAVTTTNAPGGDTARPVSLASDDFNNDGIPDLICGYAKAGGGLVTLHAGNVDAIFPHSPGARTIQVPVSPEFLAAGDFDGDDHRDVVVADGVRPSLYLLSGNGSGGFAPAVRVALPAAVTALASGEINRADGLPDLAVGVGGEAGAALLVFEGPLGALRSEPEALALDTAPGALFLGRFYGGPWNDVAVATGRDLVLLQGRDRRLVLGERQLAMVGPPVVERIEMPSAIEAVAWGDFAWEPFETREMAVLLSDGTLRLLTRNEKGEWTAVGRREVVASAAGSARSALVPLRLSGQPTTDLAFVGGSDEPLRILSGMVRRDVASSGGTDRLANAGTLTALEAVDSPIAVLPMRLNADALSDLVLLLPGVNGPVVAATAPLATLTVNTTADNSIGADGFCTLREAITNSNTDSDTTSGDCAAGSGVDTIGFNIAGGGVATIVPVSTFPALTDAVTIDGRTQGCAGGLPCIALDGSAAGLVPAGLSVAAGPSTIRGLAVHSFLGNDVAGTLGLGIFITSSGNFIEGNFIGTDITGLVAMGNWNAGIRIEDGSSNTIGGTNFTYRNLISAAVDSHGMNVSQVDGIADGNEILGNFIGTDISGTLDLGNAVTGIRINLSTNTTIGGTAAGARNLISGNESQGILLAGGTNGNLLLGNYVGTDVTGTLDLGNSDTGIYIWESPVNDVGGTTAAARNVIAGNDVSGLLIVGVSATNNLVLGNYIGVDTTGTVALGNTNNGISSWDNASNNTIGGTTAGARNVIAANGFNGIRFGEVQNSVVLGNYIGTDASGTVDLGNLSVGVRIIDSRNNTIGGDTPGSRNIISGNESDGVFIGGSLSQDNAVVGNRIGTDVTGTVDLGNTLVGVEVDTGASKTTIGGTNGILGRNIISGNEFGGVLLEDTSQNTVQGNYIGTNSAGTTDLGNTEPGIWIQGQDNTIGGADSGARNIISGNDPVGIYITGAGATGNRVLGNFIGTDFSGTINLANGWDGIDIVDGPSGNTVGGDTAAARNIISGNEDNGIFMRNTTLNSVLGNFIGTDVSGYLDLGNPLAGVRLFNASENTIGGTADGARNIISGNDTDGVFLLGSASQNNVVLGNFIGTTVNGHGALGNLLGGVEIQDASNNTVGGTADGAGNVISANGWGVVLESATGNEIIGNSIGLKADGTSPLGNNGHAIVLLSGTTGNKIGGTGVTPGRCDGPCNRIGFTIAAAQDGVRIQAGAGNGNSILGNSIFGSAELGIDLEISGVTPNDLMDPDAGANNQQNFPVLSMAEGTPAGLTVSGTFNSMPIREYRLEFYGSTACDDSGHGEGARYLGFHTVSTDGSGDANFVVPSLVGISNGDAVTATATSIVFASPVDTSEFSQCIETTCLSLAPLGQTIFAANPSRLTWALPDDVQFVRGPLATVGSYPVTRFGTLPAATSLDITFDPVGAGSGFYYLVRPAACGSWQNALGDEPDRDAVLP